MKSQQVRAWLDPAVITVTKEMKISEVLELFILRRIQGAPVVSVSGELEGFVSQMDIMHKAIEMGYYCEETAQVEDVMTRQVQTVSPHIEVSEVARMMTKVAYFSYPVVDNGRLIGIITRNEVLKALNDSLSACHLN